MASDYNANLIADLYSAENAEKATHISDEMVKIGDAIFPRQIYEAYKKFRKTSVSHYFVSDLTYFKTGDSAEILKEIAHTTDKDGDIAMMIGYLTDIQYFHNEIVKKIKIIFEANITLGEIKEYDLEKCFVYLEKSGEDMVEIEFFLKKCFEDDRQTIETRKIALKKLLKVKPKEYINFYYDNYNFIVGKKTEIIFVEEISTWRNGIVPLVHQRILELGSERAKEILQKEQLNKDKEKQGKEIKEQNEIREEYQTADIISAIAELRVRINKFSLIDEKFGFPIFSSSEEIYQQGKPAKDKAMLVGYCIVLRSMLGNFDDEIIKLEITKEMSNEFEIKDLKGSINKFYFILLERKINVDPGIYGLRNINRIVSKLAHPDEEITTELTDILIKEKLFDYYKDDNWSMLHREILSRYKEVLEKLMVAICEKV
ncbi:MAG: hypothetical protein WCT16_02240 [Candidatus Buchananbacteria bacterium]